MSKLSTPLAACFFLGLSISSLAESVNKTQEFYVDGLKVIYKNVPKQIISARFVINGGTANYSKQREGIELLALELAATGGTNSYPVDEFYDQLDAIGSEITVSAAYDYGTVDLLCLKKYWNASWSIFSDVLLHPSFDEEEFRLLKQQLIIDATQNYQDPDTRIKNLAMSNVFHGQAYEADPDGSVESLSALTLLQVSQYYKTQVNKNNCFLVVVGDLDTDELKKQVTLLAQNLPSGKKHIKSKPFVVKKGPHRIHKGNSETNYLRGYMNAPRLNTKEGFTMMLAAEMLNERIFDKVRRDEGLSYNPRAYYATGIINNPYCFLYVSTTNPSRAIQLMVEILNEVRLNGFSTDELFNQKATYLTYYYLDQQTTDLQSLEIATNELRGDWRLEKEFQDHLGAISLDEVNHVIRKYTDVIRWTYLGDDKAITAKDFAEPQKIKKGR